MIIEEKCWEKNVSFPMPQSARGASGYSWNGSEAEARPRPTPSPAMADNQSEAD